MCLNPGVKPFFLSRCVSSRLWLCAGGSHVWQHDKRNLGPSWRVVQSKHWALCITKEHSAGQKHFKIYNECITFLMHPWYAYFKVFILFYFFIICSDGLFSISGNGADNWCTVHLCTPCLLIWGGTWSGRSPLITSLCLEDSERNLSALQGESICIKQY